MNTKQTPRSQAIDILCQWQKTGQSIDLIKEDFTSSFADPRDSQLAAALVFGVLRQLGHLDWIIGKFSSHPIGKMKPLTLQALRVGLFQLLYMDRIPPSAAINETVEVIKKRGQPKWLSGFVNGLLRNVSRRMESSQIDMDLPPHARLSHPQWLLDRWTKRYGQMKTEEICLANNTPAQLCLWVNGARTDRETLRQNFLQAGIQAEPGVFSPAALILPEYRGSVTQLPGFNEGLFQVQDETAQLIVLLLNPFPTGNYLDGCAGLGGKTALLAQKLAAGSSITAVEPQESRRSLLSSNMARLGFLDKVMPFSGDIAAFAAQSKELFKGVLIDAPCSGTGVIQRHPDIRWNRAPSDFRQFQEKQSGILKKAATLTALDGVLVYATCSMEPEENEEVVSLFLRENQGFELESGRPFLPESAKKLIDENGYLKTAPGKDCSDGFFAARFKRKA